MSAPRTTPLERLDREALLDRARWLERRLRFTTARNRELLSELEQLRAQGRRR